MCWYIGNNMMFKKFQMKQCIESQKLILQIRTSTDLFSNLSCSLYLSSCFYSDLNAQNFSKNIMYVILYSVMHDEF